MIEPFGFFKATPFGWEDCAETDEGSVALYKSSDLEAARREGEDRVIDKLLAAQANENAARSMCEDFRRQLAEAQADNAAMHSAAHRLALEAECFYLDCKDMALVSKWDDPLQTAISDVQAIRWSGDTKALDSAIAEAAEPYKALATDWLEFAKDVRPGCAAGSDWLSMLRERTIALAAKEAL